MPRVQNVFLFLSVSLFCLFSDCGKNLEPIESNIIFEVREIHEERDSEPIIVLQMETEKIYPNCNYSIVSAYGMSNNMINIEILGIEIPDIVLPAFGPATARIVLPTSVGDYLLHFSYRDDEGIYDLKVTDSYIKITELKSQFTIPAFNLFWRYPEKSFVYLAGTTHETSWICEDFLDTLRGEVTLTEFQFPDSGQICYPRSSQGHYYDMPAKYFYYGKEEDFDRAGDILKSYTQRVIANYSGVGLSLTNWKNKRYASWLFD